MCCNNFLVITIYSIYFSRKNNFTHKISELVRDSMNVFLVIRGAVFNVKVFNFFLKVMTVNFYYFKKNYCISTCISQLQLALVNCNWHQSVATGQKAQAGGCCDASIFSFSLFILYFVGKEGNIPKSHIFICSSHWLLIHTYVPLTGFSLFYLFCFYILHLISSYPLCNEIFMLFSFPLTTLKSKATLK